MLSEELNIVSGGSLRNPVRAHRHVFTSTKRVGLLQRPVRHVALDIDEYGITIRGIDPYEFGMSAIYSAIKKITLDDRLFTLTVKVQGHDKEVVLQLLELDGDLWTNYQTIKSIIERFAETQNLDEVKN